MSEEKFGAIIVGGGLAGCSAAIVLARAGVEVVLIERGDFCGAKNMTGGRLYGHSLEKIIPNFADEAPIERVVKHEKISMLTEDGSLDIGYNSPKLSGEPDNASYTVLRSKFDQWLAAKAEEEGVNIIAPIRVDELLIEDDRVVGVSATGDELYSDVVILADGVNSLLAQQLGMKKELEPHQVAVGAKETIRLSEEIINQRFNLTGNEGTAWLSAGDPTAGGFGGGFLYTNKDTISLGVVATLSDIGHSELSVPEMLERFKNHPTIAPLLEGGETIEYSGHLVPEDGIHMVPERDDRRRCCRLLHEPGLHRAWYGPGHRIRPSGGRGCAEGTGDRRLQQGRPEQLCEGTGEQLHHARPEGCQGLPHRSDPPRDVRGSARYDR